MTTDLDMPILRIARELDQLAPRDPAAAHIAWIDDLGLRAFDSPQLAFAARATAAGVTIPADLAAVDHAAVVTAIAHDPTAIAALLGTLVDDIGAWDDAHAMARAISDLAADPAGPDWLCDLAAVPARVAATLAATRAGNLLAIDRDTRCLTLFALVAATGPTAVDRALGAFRAAVAQIKRLDNAPDVGARALDHATELITCVPSAADRLALSALVGNLRALTYMRSGERAAARESVGAAWTAVADRALVPDALSPRFVDEVRVQVLTNLAMVVGASDSWTEALPLFREGVDIAGRATDALRMETGALLGYALYRAGDLASARAVLVTADDAGARTSAFTQRAQLRKLLAVVCDDLGDHAASERYLDGALAGVS